MQILPRPHMARFFSATWEPELRQLPCPHKAPQTGVFSSVSFDFLNLVWTPVFRASQTRSTTTAIKEGNFGFPSDCTELLLLTQKIVLLRSPFLCRHDVNQSAVPFQARSSESQKETRQKRVCKDTTITTTISSRRISIRYAFARSVFSLLKNQPARIKPPQK